MKVSLYKGHTFLVTDVPKEHTGYTGSTVGTVYRVKTGSFCGSFREQRTSGYIVV